MVWRVEQIISDSFGLKHSDRHLLDNKLIGSNSSIMLLEFIDRPWTWAESSGKCSTMELKPNTFHLKNNSLACRAFFLCITICGMSYAHAKKTSNIQLETRWCSQPHENDIWIISHKCIKLKLTTTVTRTRIQSSMSCAIHVSNRRQNNNIIVRCIRWHKPSITDVQRPNSNDNDTIQNNN